MKFLLLTAAVVGVVLAGPTSRTPISSDHPPISIEPAIVDEVGPVSVGPAIVQPPVSVGPAIVLPPISVGPANIDEVGPISVGPALVEEGSPNEIGPIVISPAEYEDPTKPPSPVDTSRAQYIVNFKDVTINKIFSSVVSIGNRI